MRIGLMLAFVACAGCHAFGRTDRLLLDHATLAEPSLYQQVHDPTVLEKMRREEAKTVPVRGHRIISGNGTVIAYRTWSPGSLLAIDDEHFEKITIFLPDALPTAAVEYHIGDASGVVLAYTVGSSAWPALACFGSARSVNLRLTPSWFGRMHVDVQFVADLQNVMHWACPSGSVHKEFTVSHGAVSSLTPWLGRAATHVYAETYPESR